MNTPHYDHIDTAFLQLSFAIKLWNFLDEYPIDKETFDIDLTIEDPGSRICLPCNEFQTYQDLQLAAENNISICFGAVAITLWEAIHEHSGLVSRKLNPINSRKESLAALSYMLRCCFAHGTARPVWSIQDSKYKTTYRVGSKSIDLSQVADQQAFDYSSIGGYETLWYLKAESRAEGLI
ncbi:MAG TPA: hypothetical protein VIW48_02425 [Nitrospiraceae bacterium]